ncbi:MAG: hypothetical protein J5J06_07605 [Phycisphaerae bacterium]|nr:hypothetical protein [Phycisphaerae bacterium]
MGRLVEKSVGGLNVQGFSLAGEETVLAVPELNVCFDVGRAPREIISIDNVCLSHGHMDHAAGIAYYFSQRNFIGTAPGRVILPAGLASPINRLMDVWGEIEGHPSPAVIVPVEPMQDVELRRGLIVRPFAVNHAGGALGFTLIDVRHKLRPEFHGLLGPEIVALKKKGVEIEQQVEYALITYTGDTAWGRFLEHPFVRDSQVLAIECTFFEPDHRSRARAGRHIHIDDMPRVMEAAPTAKILLTHFSRRTDLRVAKRMLEKMLKPEDFARITLLMERPPRPRGREGRPPHEPSEKREAEST